VWNGSKVKIEAVSKVGYRESIMNYRSERGFLSLVNILGVVLLVAAGAAVVWYTRLPKTIEQTPMPSPMNDLHETHAPIQSHRSFMIRSNASTTQLQPRQPLPYTFSIVDDQGTVVKDFVTTHEKLLHLIVVRHDLQQFQHLHPDFNAATGEFTLANLTFPTAGPYRLFADFKPATAQLGSDSQPLGVMLSEDVQVGNMSTYKAQPIVEGSLTSSVQGYQIRLAPSPTPVAASIPNTLSFTVTRGNRPVTDLEPYLGALGHVVVLREGDLEYIHTHPTHDQTTTQTGTVDFLVTFPSAAKYKIFSQMQHRGQVITTSFVITAQGSSPLPPDADTPVEQRL
jgi:hypothetical protein